MTRVAERTDSLTANWLPRFLSQPSAPAWVAQLRDAAFARFSSLGFPTVHDEDWKYTNVAAIARTSFEAAPAATVDIDALAPHATGLRFVFVNGRLCKAPKRLPAGLAEMSRDGAREYLGRSAPFDKTAFGALNTAFLSEPLCLRIAPDAVVEEPIHLVHLTTSKVAPVAVHPRVLILVGARARCAVVETFAGTGEYFVNAVTEVAVGEQASLDHYQIQCQSPQAFHIADLETELSAGAQYSTTNISLGGALARNNSGVRLADGSQATLNGLYLTSGTQHVDNQLVVDHAAPNASSSELYKGVLDDASSAAFNGKILVRPGAQKTDARQSNRNLLLSDAAVINTKPELQILADDVRCTHGATIGQLDAEAVFYLRSRGIDDAEARAILTYAFAQDVIDRIQIPALREKLGEMIHGRLHDRR